MPSAVLIVEGDGDVLSAPHLVGKLGDIVGEAFYSSRPIRVGGWLRLRKEGGLEKWCRVAARRDDCDRIVILCDLDDHCPVEEKDRIRERIDALSYELGKPIAIAFCIREYESWLLQSADILAEKVPQYGWLGPCPPGAETIRDAKGALRRIMSEPYAESLDQEVLTRAVDCKVLFGRSRSFRSFVKAVTGYNYEELSAVF